MVTLKDLIGVFRTHSKDLTKLFHIALKKIPYFSKGKEVKPTKNNGYKFELFANGFIPYLKPEKVVFYQVVREEEFAPVKNEPGNPQDSPDTARKMLSDLHKGWLISAGAKVAGEGLCEVDSRMSYEGEGLERFKGKEIKLPAHVSF